MKKYLLVAMYMVALTFTACGRQTGKILVSDRIKTAGNYYLNDINPRAVRDFVDRHMDASDVEWYKLNQGYIVKFLMNGIKCQSTYRGSGNWIYTIRYYHENQMPRDVRATVKRVYYDFAITQVEEIKHVNSPLVYIVHMKDSTSWCNVRVCDGEMDVLEAFSKRK